MSASGQGSAAYHLKLVIGVTNESVTWSFKSTSPATLTMSARLARVPGFIQEKVTTDIELIWESSDGLTSTLTWSVVRLAQHFRWI
jgi:hypothetical protein